MKVKKISKTKCPYKAPRPPRCLCRTWIDWLFHIVSPSLLLVVENDKAKKYRKEVREYFRKCNEWHKSHVGGLGKKINFVYIDELHEIKGGNNERGKF